MPKCLSVVCLLLASFHSCLQNKQRHDGEKGTSEIAISCLKDLQDLEIYSPFSETAIGRNVTLECRSQKGCLPINYTLYLNTMKMQHIIQRKAEEKVVFNITINSISDVGEYKCKAQNNASKYSPGFNFTLRDEAKDVRSCSDPVSKLEISSPVSEILLGGNVTLECKSVARCLPIYYSLFLNKDKELYNAIKNNEEERIVFNFTITSSTQLGTYKCRARSRQNDSSTSKYSNAFNFVLKEEAKDVRSCSDPVSKLEISSPVSEILLGGNVTLECKSVARCLPIYYSLFLNRDKELYNAIKNNEEERIVFNFTITSSTQLGTYKCRARNRLNDPSTSKYSNAFNFVLKAPEEENNKLVVYIIAPLLLLLLLMVIAVAIPLMILPWCKAKNQKSASTSTRFTPIRYLNSETCPTYDDVACGKEEEIVYCSVKTETMERECSKETLTEDTTVNYAEIVIRR